MFVFKCGNVVDGGEYIGVVCRRFFDIVMVVDILFISFMINVKVL